MMLRRDDKLIDMRRLLLLLLAACNESALESPDGSSRCGEPADCQGFVGGTPLINCILPAAIAANTNATIHLYGYRLAPTATDPIIVEIDSSGSGGLAANGSSVTACHLKTDITAGALRAGQYTLYVSPASAAASNVVSLMVH
jgi:hypothetical protein